MSDKLVIIDGNSIFYRSFYALPLLTNSDGEFSNAIYGFAIQILHIINEIEPKYIVVAFDAGKHTFRNDMFDGYKATRKPMPDELRSQLLPLKQMLGLMNIKIVEKIGIEGDDIIGITSKKFPNIETIIVTGDRDSFQLVDDSTKVYFTKKGTSDVKIMGVEELQLEYGVSPTQFIDLKALQGDSADNIPGVAGIGPKTATSLISKYGSLEEIYNHIDEITGKTREKLENDREMAFLSKKLATIMTSGDLDVDIEDCTYDFPFSTDVYNYFKKYEFKTLLKNEKYFNLENLENQKAVNYKKILISKNEDFFSFMEKFNNVEAFSFFVDADKVNLSIGDGNEYVINLAYDLLGESIDENLFFDRFKLLFENKNIQKICFNSKKDMYTLKRFSIKLNNYFDVAIAKNLVDGVSVVNIEDVLSNDEFEFVASSLFDFSRGYAEKIKNENLTFLFEEVETPLVEVLFSMENEGFKLDRKVILSLKEKYSKELEVLEKEIYGLAGTTFNINSPKQLAKVLYEDLGLPHGKKMSTSAENLELISNQHAIINVILRYRKVSKFLGTYIDGMLPHLDKNDFVHTNFTQTLTSTGRLSSVEPNLQNIPIRSEESREIRSMFVASDENHILIDADYSQIELRLLAHCSEDENFIKAFKNNIDIHTSTASNVFGVPNDLVTPEMRRTAKIVNFGIIYGISDFGLAEDLKIKTKQAKELIDSFYNLHPAIKKYMEMQIENAKETGKAVTIFGRSRKIPEIKSSNYLVRTRAERASQNMPLQGTAADIIKIAMVNTYKALKNGNYKSKLIMQVHDELIIDAPIDEVEDIKKLLKEQMENAVKLKVKLSVDVKSSYRWSDGH